MFLPQLFKIHDKYRVSIALINWKYYDTAWMDNPEMPVGAVSQPDTDVTITSVMCEIEKEAFNQFNKMTDICASLNDITNYSYKNCIETAVDWLKSTHPELIIND